ncbi:cytochrome c oxidase polypeptide Via isoform 1, putative [Pediculus humanus corporis]|uniref:Cytochrome c oxidase polypeptide Via isoform 1, putative n=1 Tax=Pediculus humanus subsp. corporis TaxID=121224 RepID=E0VKX7_PEDHC|nr:cytochrome c oxidase polypeptide Via isoform 1, putative [Pediculus humanus corporis]EEB14033.1 cytochrome c oxidase polypeptide Via isoform 1, putative [Pediculus humanus corporis]
MSVLKHQLLLRNIYTNRAVLDSLKEPLKVEGISKYAETASLWKKTFIFACIPILALCTFSVMIEEHPERPEFVKYSYLRIRKKKYPWGDGNKTLFHHPHYNALPDGYEESEESAKH